MKTLNQIVADKIARSAALVHDRMQNDPSLAMFTAHFAQALAGTLKVLPEAIHAAAIQSLLMQTVVEWEDVALEYDGQLKPAPLG
jgi:hypothetical protein